MIKYDISLNTYSDINNLALTKVLKTIFSDDNRVFVAEKAGNVWESNSDLTSWQCVASQSHWENE